MFLACRAGTLAAFAIASFLLLRNKLNSFHGNDVLSLCLLINCRYGFLEPSGS